MKNVEPWWLKEKDGDIGKWLSKQSLMALRWWSVETEWMGRQRGRHQTMPDGKEKKKYTNANTQTQIHKYKYTNTQIHKYTNTQIQIQYDS